MQTTCVRVAAARQPYARKAQKQRAADLRDKLDQAFRRALAAKGVSEPFQHGVYRSCFPNESTAHDYVKRSAKRVEECRCARTREFAQRVRQRAGVE